MVLKKSHEITFEELRLYTNDVIAYLESKEPIYFSINLTVLGRVLSHKSKFDEKIQTSSKEDLLNEITGVTLELCIPFSQNVPQYISETINAIASKHFGRYII